MARRSSRSKTGGGVKRFPTTELFQRQMAEKLAIPFPYFERMRTLQPELLDRNVNTWLHAEPVRRMVRALDGRARALLSDRYRRLDNYDLVEHVLPLLQALPGARFESVQLTERRMYLKVVTPRVAAEIQPGDLVQAGVVVSNSEVGEGSLSVQPLLYRLVCKNGLIASRALRKHHIGRLTQSAEDEVVLFKDDTLQADDRAFFLKVRDVVQSAVSEATLEHLAGKMRRTLGIRLTGDPVKAVESVSVKFLMTEPERCGRAQAPDRGRRPLGVRGDQRGHPLLAGSGGLRPCDRLRGDRRQAGQPLGGRMGADRRGGLTNCQRHRPSRPG